MSNTRIDVTGGDSKFEFLAQLNDIKRVADRPTFRMTVSSHHPALRGKQHDVEIGLHINGIIAEDGSGEGWLIQGYVVKTPDMPGWLINLFTDRGNFSGIVRGYYHTRARTGWLAAGPLKLV